MSQLAANVYRAANTPDVAPTRPPLDRTAKLSMRTRTYTARTVGECLQMAKQELGVEAMILSKKSFRQGAVFGRWGGREMVEVTFGTYRPATPPPGVPSTITFNHGVPEAPAPEAMPDPDAGPALQKLESQIAGLASSMQALLENGGRPANRNKKTPAGDAFVSSPVEARVVGANGGGPLGFADAPAPVAETIVAPKPPRRSRSRAADPIPASTPGAGPYPGLMQQLLDADVAPPLARQLLADVPEGLPAIDAANALRTAISQRLRIAPRLRPDAGAGMRLVAFVGTTGVGKTTTVAKLMAQFAVMERHKVGVITLDTHRIAAAQQLQTYGQILKVPVLVAHDRVELLQHVNDFKEQGMELVLIDTAGRSPNDMLPLGETNQLFDGLGPVQKFLAVPATLAPREMDHIVSRFQSILTPDALLLTKLDEATDNSCFGKLLTLQAKHGLPLAYVTTGQKVPDDITVPDAHAIAARILTTALL